MSNLIKFLNPKFNINNFNLSFLQVLSSLITLISFPLLAKYYSQIILA